MNDISRSKENRKSAMNPDLKEQILALEPGSHLCLFYDNHLSGQIPAIVPFIKIGLENQEQVVYIADDNTVAELTLALKAHMDADDFIRSGSLIFLSKKEWRQSGPFDVQKKLEQVEQFVQKALQCGYNGVRFLAEMTWSLNADMTQEELRAWESAANNLFVPGFPALALCQYNNSRLSAETILTALYTYPQVIVKDNILVNEFYRPMNVEREKQADTDRMILQLRQTEELQKKHRMYEAILSSTPDFVYIFDLNHRFTYANKALLEMWGRTWDDAVGKNCLELGYEPWHAAMHDREIEQVITTKKPARGQVPFHGTYGRRIYDYIFVPVLDVDGNVEAIAGTTRDVTEQKKIQETLQSDVEAMKLLKDLGSKFLSDFHIQNLYEEINATARKLTNADAGTVQILDQKTQNLILISTYGFPPDSPERFAKVSAVSAMSCGSALSSGMRTFVDFNDCKIHDPKGDLQWHLDAGYLSAQSTPLIARSGQAIGMLSTHWRKHYRLNESESHFLDLLARQAADLIEQRLSEHAVQHLAAIVASSDDAIISKDLQGTITSWNNGAERMFGYKAKEVVGQPIMILTPKDRRDGEPVILQEIHQGKSIDYCDTVRRHKNGSLIDVSLVVSPIRDSNGRIIGASKIARNIGERKKAEDEFKKLSMELEQRVVERTKALEDQTWRLRELAVELTQVEQKERRRLAEVLHDHLQQYLVIAKMRIELSECKSGELLLSGLKDARLHIDKAIDASRQLTAELRPPVLYEGGLNAGLKYLRQKMESGHGLKIHLMAGEDTEPGSDLIKVMIYQCIQELLFNAVKYAGVLDCFVTVRRMDNDIIRVTIEDKGRGFDVTKIGSNDKGGFGLFSIRERVKAMGGEFVMFSVIGEGATFTLSIPDKIEMPTVEEIIGLPKEAAHSKAQSQNDGIVVLVADDHPIIRQSIASLLMTQPFIKAVLEAANGEEAVRKAISADPDVILMDINMPVMNGIEATQLLSNRNPRSKVIGLSVQAEVEMAKPMLAAGAVAYFNKGDDTQSLIETIKELAYQPFKDSQRSLKND